MGLALTGRPVVVSEPTPRNTREGVGAGRKASTGTNEAIRRGHCISFFYLSLQPRPVRTFAWFHLPEHPSAGNPMDGSQATLQIWVLRFRGHPDYSLVRPR